MEHAIRESADDLEFRARAHAVLRCCTTDCFMSSIGYRFPDAVNVLVSCYNEVNGMGRKQKKEYMRAKIESTCVAGLTDNKYLKMKWCVGISGLTIPNICRTRFATTYNIGKTLLNELCSSIKLREVNSDLQLSDNVGAPSVSKVSEVTAFISRLNGPPLTIQQLQALNIPNTTSSLEAFAWMNFYFTTMGDSIPNSNGQIHLEPISAKEIFEEYEHYCADQGKNSLQKTQFGSLWVSCFSHVSIREFKAVTGKCTTCATLSHLRRTVRDNNSRTHITQLHMLHRTTYMGERMAYVEKCQLAIQMPSLHLSLVSDGMAQSHCILPWLGNLAQTSGITQHIQGVLLHGRGQTLYRTFHNLGNSANLQIHTFLLTLEEIFVREGNRLPPTIFYQIDGGSENTSKTVILLCELLIMRGLTKKVVLTRLMVGHTHSDIDATFGTLWSAIRLKHVYTPSAYEREIVHALSTSSYKAKVVDLFVVPDYDQFLLPELDKKFKRYCKEAHTQLVFTFDAVGLSVDFPTGVRTSYRAYSQDRVIEIVENAGSIFNLKAQTTIVASFPPATDTQPGGMFIMLRPPSVNKIGVTPFLAGSRAMFDAFMNKMRRLFLNNKVALDEWEAWGKDRIPQTDFVEDHLKIHPKDFHVPFLNQLFMRGDAIQSEDVRSAAELADDLEVVYANDCVAWHRRGETRGPDDEMNCPRMTADGKGIGPKKQNKTPTATSAENAKNKDPKSAKIVKVRAVKEKRPSRTAAQRKKPCATTTTSTASVTSTAGVTSTASVTSTAGVTSTASACAAQQVMSEKPQATTGDEVLKSGDGGRFSRNFRTPIPGSDHDDNYYLSGSGHDNSPYFCDVSSNESVASKKTRIFYSTKRRKRKRKIESSSESSSESDNDSEFSRESEISWDKGGADNSDASDADADFTCKEPVANETNPWTMEQDNFSVPRYGCSALYFGRKFKFIKAPNLEPIHASQAVMNSPTAKYIIVGVARHIARLTVLCFKFYDSAKHRTAPLANSGEWYYIPCMFLMSTDSKIVCMQLLPLYGAVVAATGLSLVGRSLVRNGVRGVVKYYNGKDDVYDVEINNRRENFKPNVLMQYLC